MKDVIMKGLCYAGTNLCTPNDDGDVVYEPAVVKHSSAPSTLLIKRHDLTGKRSDTDYFYSEGILFQYTPACFEETLPSGYLRLIFTLPANCWINEPNNKELKIPFSVIEYVINSSSELAETFQFVGPDGSIIRDPIIRVTRPPQ